MLPGHPAALRDDDAVSRQRARPAGREPRGRGRPRSRATSCIPRRRGASNVWAQNAIYDLYDPDRARAVLQAGATAKTWKDFVDYWTPLHAEHGRGRRRRPRDRSCEPSTSPTEARLVATLRAAFPAGARRRLCAARRRERRRRARARRPAPTSSRSITSTRRASSSRSTPTSCSHDRDAVRLRARLRRRPARRRRRDAMNRLYVAESTLTITGIAADHRLAAAERTDRGPHARARRRARHAGRRAGRGGRHRPAQWVTAVAKDLKANAGQERDHRRRAAAGRGARGGRGPERRARQRRQDRPLRRRARDACARARPICSSWPPSCGRAR